MHHDQPWGNVSRRSVLISAAIVPIAAIRSAAQGPAKAPPSGLSPDQLRLVDAIADRLIPRDENGPGASDCGAANYIDRLLGDENAAEKPSFVEGLTALDAVAAKSHGKPFVELTPEMKDAVLTEVESTAASRAFFTRIRRLTLEGTFSDPFYGGNKGFAGWDLIGYPGPRLAVGPDEQKMHIAIKPVHISVWGGANSGH